MAYWRLTWLVGRKPRRPEHVDDQTALVLLADLGLDHLARLLPLGRLGPDPLGLGPAQGENDVAVLVLRREHVDLDLVALVELDGVGIAPHPQLAVGDDALTLGADIHQDLVGVDAHDNTVDDVSVTELANVLVIQVEVVLHCQDPLELRLRGGLGQS